MTTKGDAYAIAIALYGEGRVFEDMAETLYQVTDSMFTKGCPDEYKADLYARIADGLKEDTAFSDAVLIIEAAIDAANGAFYG